MLIINEQWEDLRRYAEANDINYGVLLMTLGNNPITRKKIKCISKNFKAKYPNVTLIVEKMITNRVVIK